MGQCRARSGDGGTYSTMSATDKEVEYRITEDDYVKAASLGARATKRQLVNFGGAALMLALVIVFGPAKWKIIGLFGLIGGAVGYCAALFLVTPWNARKNYRKLNFGQHPLKLRFTGEEFAVESEGKAAQAKWEELPRWRENNDIILLYLAPRMYYLIPKRVARAGLDVEQIGRLLREKVGPPI